MKKNYEFITKNGLLVRFELDSKDLNKTKAKFGDYEVEGYAYASAVDGLIILANKDEFNIYGKDVNVIHFEVEKETSDEFRTLTRHLSVLEYRERNNVKREECNYTLWCDERIKLDEPINFARDVESTYTLLDVNQAFAFYKKCLIDNDIKKDIPFWEVYKATCLDEEILNYARSNGTFEGNIVKVELPKDLLKKTLLKNIKREI